jgi:lysophospholipase L1-like esterase
MLWAWGDFAMTKPYVFTALGDSLTFGSGADEYQGFVQHVHKRLEECQRGDVTLHHHGTIGATTSELLKRVRTDETVRKHLRKADFITLTAGGNDLIQAAQKMYMEGHLTSMKPAMRAFFEAYKLLLKEVHRLNRTEGKGGGRVILLECYNPLPTFKDAILWVRFLNRCISRASESFAPQTRVASVYPAFLKREEELISEDAVHPNNAGHSVLAGCVEATLKAFARNGGNHV